MKNIVIVGGGSSGWMTAAILAKSFPEKNITVVESPDYPIIGVGESTFDGIKYYCEYLEIDEKDFLKETDASFKLAIEFQDFYQKNGNKFYFSFGKPLLNGTRFGLNDWLIKKYVYPETDVNEFAESYFPQMSLINNNTFDNNSDGSLDNFNYKTDVAYHFDAIKFGLWLKNKYCVPRGVKIISGTVSDAQVSENGIDFLIVKNEKIYADLFIDCTGFKSLLLEKYMGEKFISYSHILPNNKAWATQIDYVDKEKELKPVTKCTAINNGWVWEIPLWSRIGTGYVYSDEFISEEDALKEFKEYLTKNLNDLPRKKEIVDSLNFKDINIKAGRHEKSFVKNVVAIGLSSAFIEPLESNGLYTVHQFLFHLVRSLLREKVTQWDRDVYNLSVNRIFDKLAEFVAIHYSLSNRNDTKYWEKISKTSFLNQTSEGKDINNLILNKTEFYVSDVVGGHPWISAGMNYFALDSVSARLGEIELGENYKYSMQPFFTMLEERKFYWDKIAKTKPSLYQYLKNNIHT